MIPITKNFIFYDGNRNPLAFPAEYYGDAIVRNLDGTERRITLSQSQINDLNNGRSLSDSSIIPLAKYGLVAEMINIPSVGQEIFTNNNDSQSHINVERFHKNNRPDITVTFKLFASDWTDYSLKVSRYRAWLNSLGKFYVADINQPFKLYEVMISGSIEFEQPQYRTPVGEADITLMKVGSVFGESLHTTMTIDSEGMQFNDKWAYGMGTRSSENYWQYSFANEDPTFYNAGTEEVKLIQQKESLITLKINAVPTNGLIDIDDGTTTFKLWYDFKVGDVLRIHGDKVTLNGKNVLGDTNFNFLTVKTGWNYWDVRGIPNRDYEFKIDFRYLYD